MKSLREKKNRRSKTNLARKSMCRKSNKAGMNGLVKESTKIDMTKESRGLNRSRSKGSKNLRKRESTAR